MKNKTLKLWAITCVIGGVSCLWWLKFHAPLTPKTKLITKPHGVSWHLQPVKYKDLPGWRTASLTTSLHTFQASCHVILNKKPDQNVGSTQIALKARAWYPACRAALALKHPGALETRAFFQKWLKPVEFIEHQQRVRGLFTGYYSPLFDASLTKTSHYSVPLYGLPPELVQVDLGLFNAAWMHHKISGRVVNNQLIPFYTHKDIVQGALSHATPVIAWVHSPLDRMILSIEGSGALRLRDGSLLSLGYAGENGAPYTSIGRVLIDQGIMTMDNASMQRIVAYLSTHPDKMQSVLQKNESFVFFHVLKQHIALGAQGIPLTAGYSLAVDRQWIPLGTPLWLSTTRPIHDGKDTVKMRRLMIAQDTGGAIRGPVRGDVYWGEGESANAIAGFMKNHGHYWLLLPRTFFKA